LFSVNPTGGDHATRVARMWLLTAGKPRRHASLGVRCPFQRMRGEGYDRLRGNG
jgi:hypothetical protein